MRTRRHLRRIAIVDIDRSFWKTILIDEQGIYYTYRHWYMHPSREARKVEKRVRQLKIRDHVEFQFHYSRVHGKIGLGKANQAVIYTGCLHVPSIRA